MKKLAEFMLFLTGLNLVAAERITPYVEKVQLFPSGKNNGATQSTNSCVICRQKITAVIDIECYPHAKHSPAELFAHVSAWLIDNDTDRYDLDDAQPEIMVDVLDDETADVMINIEFAENVVMVEDVLGAVTLAGKKWAVSV